MVGLRGHSATLLNKTSSRSHSMFTMTIEMTDKGADGGARVFRAGKLNMV